MNTQPVPARTVDRELAGLQNTSIVAAKDRELAIVAAFAAMGRKVVAQLPEHIHAALDAGATQQQIIEGLATISQASGTPSAVNAIAVADKVFKDRVASGRATEAERAWDEGDAPGGTVAERLLRAQGTIEQVYPAGPADDTYTAVAQRAPHFWRDAATVFYNDLFLHPGIGIKYRELFIMSTYVALNSTPLQMKWHTNGALNTGWTRQEVLEIITQLAPFVGIPNALSAARSAQEVFADRDASGATRQHEAGTRDQAAGAVDSDTGRAHRLDDLAARVLLGDALGGVGLDPRTRHIAVVSALAAHGVDGDELAPHVDAARRAGVTDNELAAAVKLSAAIAGQGVAVNAESVISRIDN
jgi:4-carboxymuconolactone decarboxylase